MNSVFNDIERASQIKRKAKELQGQKKFEEALK